MARPSEEWQRRASGLLRAEIARRNLSYRQVVEELAKIGVKESESNIANKLARGSFSAAFFVQCLDAVGCRVLRLKEEE